MPNSNPLSKTNTDSNNNLVKPNSIKPSILALNSSIPSTVALNTKSTYWTITHGVSNRSGYSCRECKGIIKQGDAITVRDGRKMRFFYHSGCFSNDSDPRTQSNSTFNIGRERYGDGLVRDIAPPVKGKGKWSTNNYGYFPK